MWTRGSRRTVLKRDAKMKEHTHTSSIVARVSTLDWLPIISLSAAYLKGSEGFLRIDDNDGKSLPFSEKPEIQIYNLCWKPEILLHFVCEGDSIELIYPGYLWILIIMMQKEICCNAYTVNFMQQIFLGQFSYVASYGTQIEITPSNWDTPATSHTNMVAEGRLRELAPTARGSQDVGSCNLPSVF